MPQANIYNEKDASLEPLAGKTIVFLGYGNQGRAQCLNLRDTLSKSPVTPSPTILVANLSDRYAEQATVDKIPYTTDFAQAASQADILFLLIPDQFQPEVYNGKIAPNLKKGCCVVVASGYNVFYNKLDFRGHEDVVMVAPRMIGTSVRSLFEKGQGFPCFVSVEQDRTGHAQKTALSLSLGIGALQGTGAIESSCREETLLDLFAEQAIWPSIIRVFLESYSLLKGLGCSDEALVHELWLSKEPMEIMEKCADDGFIRQLVHHSTVSQYGQLKGAEDVPFADAMRSEFRRVAERRVLGGEFEKEFSGLEAQEEEESRIDDGVSNGEVVDANASANSNVNGEAKVNGVKGGGKEKAKPGGGVQRKLDELYQRALKSELGEGEIRVRARLGLKTL